MNKVEVQNKSLTTLELKQLELLDLPKDLQNLITDQILNSLTNQEHTIDSEVAATVSKLAIVLSNLFRESAPPKPRSLSQLYSHIRYRLTHENKPGAWSNVITINCRDIVSQAHEFSILDKILEQIVLEFAKFHPNKNHTIDVSKGLSMEEISINYLDELIKVTGVWKQTCLFQNFDSLSPGDQIAVAERLSWYLSDRNRFNFILFHEKPIKTGNFRTDLYAFLRTKY